MDISNKDLTKLMNSLTAISKHFAEEKAKSETDAVVEDEDENVEEPSTTTSEDDDDVVKVVRLPEDIAETVREALEEADDDTSTEDDDADDTTESEDEDDETEENEEDFCDSTNFSEFFKYTQAITETVENLNRKADKISKAIDEASKKNLETFSNLKQFNEFAGSVNEALKNISNRVNLLSEQVKSKSGVTKDLSNIENVGDNYEKEFITKSKDDTLPVNKTVEQAIVQTPAVSVEQCATTDKCFSVNTKAENDVAQRYSAVKDFLSLDM